MNRIKCLRMAKRMSQKQLADALFVNQSAVSHWENGSNGVDFEFIEKISKLFSVPVSFVMGESFKLRRPQSEWRDDEIEDYDHARDEKDYLMFKYGQGYFDSDPPKKESAPTDIDQSAEFNKLFAQLTDEQKKMIIAQMKGIITLC